MLVFPKLWYAAKSFIECLCCVIWYCCKGFELFEKKLLRKHFYRAKKNLDGCDYMPVKTIARAALTFQGREIISRIAQNL